MSCICVETIGNTGLPNCKQYGFPVGVILMRKEPVDFATLKGGIFMLTATGAVVSFNTQLAPLGASTGKLYPVMDIEEFASDAPEAITTEYPSGRLVKRRDGTRSFGFYVPLINNSLAKALQAINCGEWMMFIVLSSGAVMGQSTKVDGTHTALIGFDLNEQSINIGFQLETADDGTRTVFSGQFDRNAKFETGLIIPNDSFVLGGFNALEAQGLVDTVIGNFASAADDELSISVKVYVGEVLPLDVEGLVAGDFIVKNSLGAAQTVTSATWNTGTRKYDLVLSTAVVGDVTVQVANDTYESNVLTGTMTV